MRRSARITAQPVHPVDPTEDDDPFKPSGLGSNDQGQPARKMRKTSIQPKTKQTKGRQGKLRQLIEMPIDILYEIFGHVRPHDLLRLSRTTKAIRGILLRRSATSVWKEALAGVNGLPDCPSDLTEPQWAHLLFDTYCHFCAGPSIRTVFWQCRVRSCNNCIDAHFVTPWQLWGHEYPELPVQGTLPCDTHTVKGRPNFLHSPSHVKALCDGLGRLQGDLGKISAFIEQKRSETNILRHHAGLCEDWQRLSQIDRSAELVALRNGRKKAIVEKIREVGYGPELDDRCLDSIYKLPLVDKPQELTERVWTNIKQGIIGPLEQDRRERAWERRVLVVAARTKDVGALFTVWKDAQPRDNILPALADICDMPVCRALILDPADDVKLNSEDISKVIARLPQLSDEWRVAADRELMRLMSPLDPTATYEAGESVHDRRRLELATTFFYCTGCECEIGYPRILVHRCRFARCRSHQSLKSNDDDAMIMWKNAGPMLPWGLNLREKVVYCTDETPALVRCLLATCNLDPLTTTSQEMDGSDFRFECENCWAEDEGALAMTWRAALAHSLRHKVVDEKWRLLGEADCLRVKEADKDHEINGPPSLWWLHSRWTHQLTCCHCSSVQMDPEKMRVHLCHEHHHNFKAPMTNADCFICLDNPPSKYPVRLQSEKNQIDEQYPRGEVPTQSK